MVDNLRPAIYMTVVANEIDGHVYVRRPSGNVKPSIDEITKYAARTLWRSCNACKAQFPADTTHAVQ